MRDFAGKTAVITGGASGIGFALAEAFAAAGARLALADIDDARLAEAVTRLRATGATVIGQVTDVSRLGDVEELAARASAVYGAIHIVCNNAGVAGAFGPSWEVADEDWAWAVGINFGGVLNGVRVFTPILLQQDEPAHIVNTASISGLLAMPYAATYTATKAAVIALSEALYFELQARASKVKVSVLCPGGVRTRIAESARAVAAADGSFERQKEGVREAIAAGTDPAVIAALTLEAIREERFWIFPHPELLDWFRGRVEGILGGTNPASGEILKGEA